MSIRVRFAPSPTGFLHVGGARTALFNWLLARRHKGTFILRIEDTDLERSTPEATEQILRSLEWIELNWDEGPIFQTHRFDRYREALAQLLASKAAYRCRCTAEELERKRAQAEAEKRTYQYDRACRDQDYPEDGTPSVVRFKSQLEGEIVVEDAILGTVRKQAQEVDDWILARTDRTPTYNFCVVIDDLDMRITHVVRAMEHLVNTHKQLPLYSAFGATPPRFAHVPVINGPDGKKLSKRRDAEYREMGFTVSVLEYRDMGYLPEALVNYLAKLGWAHGDQEIFTREELVNAFDLDGVGKSPAIFDAKKLRWLNQHYMKLRPSAELVELLQPHIARLGAELPAGPRAERLVDGYRERSVTLAEMAKWMLPYLQDSLEMDAAAAAKHLTPASRAPLAETLNTLSTLEPFDVPTIEAACKGVVERCGIKLGQLAQPLRVALTGGTASPGIFDVIEMMGRERALGRIRAAIEKL